ncbi:cytochrome P450 [Actinoallomurus spadix]|uniref:Cytochrome P450 n=1 Tax=Actinoallomurus spadix TaxID=79912 RepID=A0ABN0X9F2_9ACTN|nr:cytochrome P450 [Actinoallomurus spadix]MCO5987954.1 cytochrome P450 [Actinoallomurus spadix]
MSSETRRDAFATGCPAHGGRTPLYGPEFAARPRQVYDALRRYGAVAPVELAPGVPASLVISYNAALDVLRDPVTFPKDARRWQRSVPSDCPVLPFMMYRPAVNLTDGAAHTRLRAAIADGLSRIDPNTVRESVERNVDTLMRGFSEKGSVDLRAEYALVLPMLVFNEILGCPPEIGERIVTGMRGVVENVDAADNNQLAVKAVAELVALKRARPGQDLTSWLIEHPSGLTDQEVIEQIFLLVGLATETEQNLIVNALLLLLSDDRFAGDLSGGNLPVEDALEEVLWADPPVANWAISYPTQDVALHGVLLPADQPVVIGFAAANTDPAAMSMSRAGNRAHLAWGAGPHKCPAQSQARTIASIAIERVLDALPDLELAVPTSGLEWRPGFAQRALVSLPVRFAPVHIPPRPTPGTQGMGRAGGLAAALLDAGPRRSNPLTRWWRGE